MAHSALQSSESSPLSSFCASDAEDAAVVPPGAAAMRDRLRKKRLQFFPDSTSSPASPCSGTKLGTMALSEGSRLSLQGALHDEVTSSSGLSVIDSVLHTAADAQLAQQQAAGRHAMQQRLHSRPVSPRLQTVLAVHISSTSPQSWTETSADGSFAGVPLAASKPTPRMQSAAVQADMAASAEAAVHRQSSLAAVGSIDASTQTAPAVADPDFASHPAQVHGLPQPFASAPMLSPGEDEAESKAPDAQLLQQCSEPSGVATAALEHGVSTVVPAVQEDTVAGLQQDNILAVQASTGSVPVESEEAPCTDIPDPSQLAAHEASEQFCSYPDEPNARDSADGQDVSRALCCGSPDGEAVLLAQVSNGTGHSPGAIACQSFFVPQAIGVLSEAGRSSMVTATCHAAEL